MKFYWKHGKREEGKPQTMWLVDRETEKAVLAITISKYSEESDTQWLMFKIKGIMERFYLRIWGKTLRY